MNPYLPAPEEEGLPPRPIPGDCCGGGCAVCVLEGYAEEVERWEREVEEIRRLRAQAASHSGAADAPR